MAKNGGGDEELLEILLTGSSGKREKTLKKIQKWFQIQDYAEASLGVDNRQKTITLRGRPQGIEASNMVAAVKAYAEAHNGACIGKVYKVQMDVPKDGAAHTNREGLTARIDHLQDENARLHTENTAVSQENITYREDTKRLEGLLEGERAKLEKLTEQKKATKVININARQDGSVPMEELYIGYMKASCVPQVKWISEAYAKVLKKLDVTPNDFKVAARIASQPLEESPEYAKAVCEKEKAEKGKRDAEKFNAEHEDWKANTELTEKEIEEKITGEARLRKNYPLYQRIVRFMKSALGEHRIPLMVTSEKTATATNINVVLPVESGADSYGALEKGMIKNVKDVLADYMMKKVGRYRTTERNGLIQFTFATRSENPNELGAEIVSSLFEAQRKGFFSNIGCRIDITVAEDTSSWTLEDSMAENASQSHAAEKQNLLSFDKTGVPEEYVLLAGNAASDGVNLPHPKQFTTLMKKKPMARYAAIMMACAEQCLTEAEIGKKAEQILHDTGLGKGKIYALHYVRNLCGKGMLVKGKRKGRAFTYTLSKEFVPEQASQLEETVAEAKAAPSDKLGFDPKGVPDTYIQLASQARESGIKLPNPRKFTSRRYKIPLERYAAIMMACAEGFMTQAEIEKKAGQILDSERLGTGEINAWWYLETLCNKGILVLSDEKLGNAFTYKLADKFRNKPKE